MMIEKLQLTLVEINKNVTTSFATTCDLYLFEL